MYEIKCPHCGKTFQVDEVGYADILKQVRDADFEQQLHERLELAERDKKNAIELATTKAANELQKAMSSKETEVQALKSLLAAGRFRHVNWQYQRLLGIWKKSEIYLKANLNGHNKKTKTTVELARSKTRKRAAES